MSLFALFLHPRAKSLPNKAVEFVLGSDDWFRLMDGRMYIVSSGDDANTLYERIKKVIEEDVMFVVSPVIPGKMFVGWLPHEAWEWLKKYRPEVIFGEELEEFEKQQSKSAKTTKHERDAT